MTLRRNFPLSFVSLALAVAAVNACSAVGGGSEFTGAGGAGGAPTTGSGVNVGGAGSSGDGFFDAGGGGKTSGSGSPGCASATQYVYTLDANNKLYKFDPPSLKFTVIGTLNCPASFGTSPYSMAVDRDANAWAVFTDGKLYKVDTATAGCKSTTFKPGLTSFITFGMGFASNSPGSSDETLYVSDSGGGTPSNTQGLGKIDLTTMKLIPIGKYDKVSARAEMTGTGDAQLFGAFEGSPYSVNEVDKVSAKILSQAPQNAINYPPNSSNFAFAFWGGDFYLFVGPGTKTDVFHYVPKTKVTTLVSSETFAIVGAGVSTCAPTKPPS